MAAASPQHELLDQAQRDHGHLHAKDLLLNAGGHRAGDPARHAESVGQIPYDPGLVPGGPFGGAFRQKELPGVGKVPHVHRKDFRSRSLEPSFQGMSGQRQRRLLMSCRRQDGLDHGKDLVGADRGATMLVVQIECNDLRQVFGHDDVTLPGGCQGVVDRPEDLGVQIGLRAAIGFGHSQLPVHRSVVASMQAFTVPRDERPGPASCRLPAPPV